MAAVAICQRIKSRAALVDASRNRLLTCEELAGGAARELTAFMRAVNQLFGQARADQAAQEWLQELACADCFAQVGTPEFRQITIAAANRLVHQISKSDPERVIARR